MELNLYHTDDSQNTINKEKTLITTKNINLKQSTNLYQTFLILKNDKTTDYSKVNYAKMLSKFYFVSYETIQNNSLIRLNLKEDVLETYKDNILNTEFDIIAKSEIDYTSNVPTSKKVQTKIIKSNVTLADDENIIVQTSGTTNISVNE